MSKEPAVIIGFVASVIVLVAQQALSSGIVTSANGLSILNLVVSLVPLIASLVIRNFVTPVTPAP